MGCQRMSRSRRSATVLLLSAFLLVLGASSLKAAASDLALRDGWEVRAAFVLHPMRDREAYVQAVGFDEEGNRLFVTQHEPYKSSMWDIHDHRLVSEANDGPAPAFLSLSPCIGLALLPSPAGRINSPDVHLTTFRCDTAEALRSIKVKSDVVRGSLVRIVQPSACRFALLQFDIGTAVVDLDRGELSSRLTRLFPRVDATIAAATDCIAYALVAPATGGATTAYRIDLEKGTRHALMRFPPIGNLSSPLLTDTFDVAPSGHLALMSVKRPEIKRSTTYGGPIRLELIDLQHRSWVRSLAESESLILGATWLDDEHILYAESIRHIAVLDIRTGAQREIHLPGELSSNGQGPLRFAISGNKRRLAFYNLSAIYVYDLPHE